MNATFNEYKSLFIEETEESIASLNDYLVALEKNRTNRRLIDDIFRVTHTLKSSAAAVGLTELAALSHKAEDVMQKVRTGEIGIGPGVINVFFAVFDSVQKYVRVLKKGGTPDLNTRVIVKKLDGLLRKDDELQPFDVPCKGAVRTGLDPADEALVRKALESGATVFRVDVVVDPREPLKWLRAELVLHQASKTGRVLKIAPAKEAFLESSFEGAFSMWVGSLETAESLKKAVSVDLISRVTVSVHAASEVPVSAIRTVAGPGSLPHSAAQSKAVQILASERSGRTEPRAPTAGRSDPEAREAGQTIRVGVGKLDELMNLVGELATAVAGVRQLEKKVRAVKAGLEQDFSQFADRLSSLTSDLQFSIMNARMLPVSTVFGQFNRIVRDLARDQGKSIELAIHGEETELDKKIIDSLGEPLMHLVRNAVDHGLESVADRTRTGKSGAGTVTLSAERSGNRIIVSVSDDGRGIDLCRVRRKAVERGLAQEEQIRAGNDEADLQYIFEPGFSTADRVTDLSGRGVGLDAVKNAVSRLNGSVNVRSVPGKGTEFALFLPLTLATTSVVLVRAGKDLYAVPIGDIFESLAVAPDEIRTVDGIPVISLRGEVLALVSFVKVFGGQPSHGKGTGKISVMVVIHKERKLGLVMDGIVGSEEIVLKNLDKNFRSLKGLSGVAILGDGRVALVVDIQGIFQILEDAENAENPENAVGTGVPNPARRRGKPPCPRFDRGIG